MEMKINNSPTWHKILFEFLNQFEPCLLFCGHGLFRAQLEERKTYLTHLKIFFLNRKTRKRKRGTFVLNLYCITWITIDRLSVINTSFPSQLCSMKDLLNEYEVHTGLNEWLIFTGVIMLCKYLDICLFILLTLI